MVFPPQRSDGQILLIGPCPQGNLPIFSVIQTHPSCRFHLAVDFPGLRPSGYSPDLIDQEQEYQAKEPPHGNLCQLERDVPAMADNLRADLDQRLP